MLDLDLTITASCRGVTDMAALEDQHLCMCNV